MKCEQKELGPPELIHKGWTFSIKLPAWIYYAFSVKKSTCTLPSFHLSGKNSNSSLILSKTVLIPNGMLRKGGGEINVFCKRFTVFDKFGAGGML